MPTESANNSIWSSLQTLLNSSRRRAAEPWYLLRVKKWLVAAPLGLLVPFGAIYPSHADHPGSYEYAVLRDGSPIGFNRVVVKPTDEGTVLELTVDSELAVKFGFLTVFRYAHRRRELWRDGKLLQVTGTTNDDGERYDFEIKSEDGRFVRVMNGRSETLAPDLEPLAFWNPASLNGKKSYFSVSDPRLLPTSVEFGGRLQAPWLPDGSVVDYYKVTGDQQRELWYDEHGHLLRVRFENRGSNIEFLLKNVPEPLNRIAPR